MHLTNLSVTDFRSWERARLALGPGVTVLVGANAQGKTNLVEAIHRAATGASHRVAGDQSLVRVGCDLGVVRLAAITDEGRRRSLDVEVGTNRRTRTRVDGVDVRRTADAMGVVKVVMFAPEDLAIVRGDPERRRRFLDELLGQRRPAYAAVRADYDRVLRQRNQLLKQLRGLSGTALDTAAVTLESWSRQLASHGATLLAARLAAVHSLAPVIDRIYRRVADRPEPIGVTYRSSTGRDISARPGMGVPDPAPLVEELRAALEEVADEERQRGVTLVGPHRDDVDLTIAGLPARTHASQGEAWSLALALKLATHDLLAEVGDRPLVILDDVFAELDLTRRRKLADASATFEQVIVTAAVEADVPLHGRLVDVTMGQHGSTLNPRSSPPSSPSPSPSPSPRGNSAHRVGNEAGS